VLFTSSFSILPINGISISFKVKSAFFSNKRSLKVRICFLKLSVAASICLLSSPIAKGSIFSKSEKFPNNSSTFTAVSFKAPEPSL